MHQRELFFKHIAQTSPDPMALEIVRAEGSRLFDASGRSFIDLIGGISVANTGHRHPKVLEAIRKQLDSYLHVMVYGEFIETPQVHFAKLLTDNLPASLNTVYFTNSGAEAIEGAMKLAKRVTGRTEIVCFDKSYHGSTQGALSLMGDEYWRNAFRPLLPGIHHLVYNDQASLERINHNTACVIAETVQGEAGVKVPSTEWMQALRKKCNETGSLLVLDEIQTGFGRTGKLWGFENFNIIPDILVLGKALGGGLPLGAFIAGQNFMKTLTADPVLGHITTFGGHPLSCAAGLASLKVILEENCIENSKKTAAIFREKIKHKKIRHVHSIGLWMAIEFDSFETNKKIIDRCLEKGILTDWFLFADPSLRISPPLTLSEEDALTAAQAILDSIAGEEHSS